MNLHEERLDLLADLVRAKLMEFHARAKAVGFPLLIVRTWSSAEDQFKLYQHGRSLDPVKGWIVTNQAQVVTQTYSTSAHMVTTHEGKPAALAMDVIPLDTASVPLWAQPQETAQQLTARWVATFGKPEGECWNILYNLAAKCGLDALGDPWGAYLRWDTGHFEEPGWKLAMTYTGLCMPTFSPTV